MKKIISIFVILIFITGISFAHSGRTDSNGGHYNRSTGEYHYHHGYSAHQHNADGSCPYEVTVETNTEPETTEKLIVVNDSEDSEKIDKLNEKITTLEEEIYAKQNTIEDLNKEIENKNEEIQNLNTSQGIWHFIYLCIIAGMIIYIYKKDKK